jgi:hypothetical protein
MPNDLLLVAHQNRFLRGPEEVQAFDGALGQYASRRSADDLAALYAMFEDDTAHHEVMFGLVQLIDEFPASDALPAFLAALPAMLPRASGWARTIMARSVNHAEASALLARLVSSAPEEQAGAARRLLAELALKKPKPVGVRAEEVLANLP